MYDLSLIDNYISELPENVRKKQRYDRNAAPDDTSAQHATGGGAIKL